MKIFTRKSQLLALQEAHDSLEQENAGLTAQVAELQKQVATLRHDARLLIEQNTTLKGQMARLNNELTDARNACQEIDNLEEKLNRFTSLQEKYQRQIEKLQAERNDLRRLLKARDEKRNELHEEMQPISFLPTPPAKQAREPLPACEPAIELPPLDEDDELIDLPRPVTLTDTPTSPFAPGNADDWLMPLPE